MHRGRAERIYIYIYIYTHTHTRDIETYVRACIYTQANVEERHEAGGTRRGPVDKEGVRESTLEEEEVTRRKEY